MENINCPLEGLTANLHITKSCNYHCKYCFEVNRESSDISCSEWAKILEELKVAGVRKINFAGGEPLLYEGLTSLLRKSSELLFPQISITTNARLINAEWLGENLKYLDIFAVSLDSRSEETHVALGRGKGDSVSRAVSAWHKIRNWSERLKHPVYMKINTVVNRLNLAEDPSSFFIELKPDKVKLLQFCYIEGENDDFASVLKVSKPEFVNYVDSIRPKLERKGIAVAAESEDELRFSYLILDPEGRFCDKRYGKNKRGKSLAKFSLTEALEGVYTEADLLELRRNMKGRGGVYEIRKT